MPEHENCTGYCLRSFIQSSGRKKLVIEVRETTSTAARFRIFTQSCDNFLSFYLNLARGLV